MAVTSHAFGAADKRPTEPQPASSKPNKTFFNKVKSQWNSPSPTTEKDPEQTIDFSVTCHFQLRSSRSLECGRERQKKRYAVSRSHIVFHFYWLLVVGTEGSYHRVESRVQEVWNEKQNLKMMTKCSGDDVDSF